MSAASPGPTAGGDLVAAARWRGDRSQRAFDALLRSAAEPGTVRHLPAGTVDAGIPAVAAPALAVADVDVSVAGSGPGAEATVGLIVDATGARPTRADDADMVVLTAPTATEVAAARRGTPSAPESAARLALAVDALHAHDETPTPDAVVLELTGPGIPGRRRLAVAGPGADVLAGLGRASGEHPTGIDAWLVGPDGAVAAIPRSTTVTVIDHPGGATGSSRDQED